MFKSLFNPQPQVEVIDIDLDPRGTPGVQGPSPSELDRWLDGDVEEVDLGSPKRDGLIVPSTWHAAGW